MPQDMILLSIAGFFSGLSQLVNKALAKTRYSSQSITVVVMVVNAILAIPLLFYKFQIPTSFYYWILVLASTLSFAFSVFFSFKAYKETDISIVSIVYRIHIVLVAIAGIVFLGETYTATSYVGLFLIFISSMLFAFEGKRMLLSAGVLYALLMAFTASLASVLDKIILQDFSPYTYAFFNNLFIGMVFAFNRKTLHEGKGIIAHHSLLVFLTALLNLTAFVIILVVLERTHISQTLPVHKAFSLIVPVVFGIVVLNEKNKVPQKLVATALGLLGIMLMYL